MICRLLRKSVAVETACEIAGISVQTYHNWRNRGKAERERVAEGHHNCRVRKDERPYVEFFEGTTRARGEAEQKLTTAWHDAAAKGDGRAAMELLQRKHPDRWSKKEIREHAGHVSHSHDFDPADLTEEQLQRILDGEDPVEVAG